MADLLSGRDFRRLRDWYGFKDVQARLPGLETCFYAAREKRRALKAEIKGHELRKRTVPQHLKDEYNEVSWVWQRAYTAYKQARRLHRELSEQYPEWKEKHE